MSEIDYQFRPREQRLLRRRRARGASGAGRAREPRTELARQICRGFNRDESGGHVAQSVARCVARFDDDAVARVALHLMLALEEKGSAIVVHDRLVSGVFRLAQFRGQWLRSLSAWTPPQTGANEQFRTLVRHLLARYPVPGWLEHVWLTDCEPIEGARRWYLHVGRGGNLSKAPGLPLTVSKRAAHFAMEAPDDLTITQALRWGQFRALGVIAELTTAVVQTRLARPTDAEPFWLTFGQWLALNPVPANTLAQLVDYVHTQRFGGGEHGAGVAPQPNFSFHERTATTLLAQSRRWHREFARRVRHRQQVEPQTVTTWPACGIAAWEAPLREGETSPAWVIRELTSAAELEEESAALGHCVWSYASDAARGRVAIFSLRQRRRLGYQPVATIEVWPDERRIAQARGRANRQANEGERKHLLAWARSAGLTLQGAG